MLHHSYLTMVSWHMVNGEFWMDSGQIVTGWQICGTDESAGTFWAFHSFFKAATIMCFSDLIGSIHLKLIGSLNTKHHGSKAQCGSLHFSQHTQQFPDFLSFYVNFVINIFLLFSCIVSEVSVPHCLWRSAIERYPHAAEVTL